MKSLADALPPEIARQVHPDWRKNEAAYWAVRDQLLGQYQGQWVGFSNGHVIAAAATPLQVFLALKQSGGHPFVIRVGHEAEPWYRIRRDLWRVSHVQLYEILQLSPLPERNALCLRQCHAAESGSQSPPIRQGKTQTRQRAGSESIGR